MKTKIIFLFFLCAITVSAQTKKWTLQECIAHALENNISIKNSTYNLKNSKLDLIEARGNFLPNLNVSSSHNWNTGLSIDAITNDAIKITNKNTTLGVNSNITIYDGLANIAKVRRANLSILANQYQLEDMKDNISLAVINSYLQIVFNTESLKTLKSQLKQRNEEYKRNAELVNSGIVPRGDLFETEAILASLEQQIVNTENTVHISKISLSNLLLLEDFRSFEISNQKYDLKPNILLNHSIESIYNKALINRNDLKAFELNIELNKENLKIAKARFLPTLNAYYNYNTRASHNDLTERIQDADTPFLTQEIGIVENSGESVVAEVPNYTFINNSPPSLFDQFRQNDGHSFGLNLSIPIFNRFINSNAVKKSKISLEKAKLDYEQSKFDLRDKVHQAYVDMQGALKTYMAALKTAKARKEAYTYAKEKHEVGLLNSFDLSQMQTNLENAETEVIRAKYDYIFKIKILEFYFGIPIDKI
jgi:outer membrane protein